MSDRARPLSESPSGSTAFLHSTRLPNDDRELLRAMGLVDHCQLRVCRQGEPCIVEVGTTRMGLARAVASEILVLSAPIAIPVAALA